MVNLDLASRYRPQRFEDVVGQKFPVQYLSALIKQGHRGQDLLLFGSVGSGKTSLVRLYAKALNCESPEDGGSPCGICKSCLDRSRGWCSEYDVSGMGGERSKVWQWTETHNRKHVEYSHQVLFYDEAHSLEPDAADSLLKMIEERKEESVCFCFATTEQGSMRLALQSRLTPLEVRPLSVHDAVKLMSRVADQENISYEISALKLLAGLKDGYPRDLLNGLAQVCGPEKLFVSLDNVRTTFDTSHIDCLLQYFMALAKGDETKQIESFTYWQEPGFRKIAWIQAFLTSVYFNDILGRDTVVDALMDTITDGERAPIIEQFCHRLSAGSRRALEPFWRRMMAFWPTPTSNPSEIDVLLRLALFHHLVNEDLSLQPDISSRHASPREVIDTTALASGEIASPRTTFNDKEDQRFLTFTDVRDIINSASFLVQAHGLQFNAHFELRLATGDVRTQQNAVDLILRFCRELEQKVDDWGRADRFAGLTVLERYPGYLHGLILAHLPRSSPEGYSQQLDCLIEVDSWHHTWRNQRTIKLYDETVVLRQELKGGADAWIFHWHQTLNLCAGLDPTLKRLDAQHGCDRPLRELLDLPGLSRQTSPVDVAIVTKHGLLRSEMIMASELCGMNLLSAFDAQAWERVSQRWELDEFESRRTELKRRQAAIAELDLEHGKDTAEGRFQREKLERRWLTKAEERARSWPGSWL